MTIPMRYPFFLALLVFSAATTGHATAGPPAEPGSIVSSRVLAADELIPHAGKGYRILYRTTGHNGQGEVSGGTVYVPAGTPPAGGWPVVSWAHGTSGMTEGCAPNLNGGVADTFDETSHLSAYLANGYAVEATDYIGLGGPGTYEYLAKRAAGHAVLDIVRAAHTVDPALSRSFVAAGHSIGGQSVLAAAQLWATYAADIDLRGTVAYGPTSNVEDLLGTLARPETPALPGLDGLHARLVMILAGLDHARPDLRVTDYLSEHGREMLAVAWAGEGCVAALEEAVTGKPVGLLFTEPLAGSPLIAALGDYLSAPTTGHQRPVLLLQGGIDTVQPAPTTVLLQEQLRADGADSRLTLHPGADHFTLLDAAAADAREFLHAVLPNS
ncbi:lipase family protein [Nocardia sp. NPDC050413]|uniref:lipase family protein n=1 Tax=Nocardia sp. NPDC050413 TaxID=3155784 RepID=UPI0033D17D4E